MSGYWLQTAAANNIQYALINTHRHFPFQYHVYRNQKSIDCFPAHKQKFATPIIIAAIANMHHRLLTLLHTAPPPLALHGAKHRVGVGIAKNHQRAATATDTAADPQKPRIIIKIIIIMEESLPHQQAAHPTTSTTVHTYISINGSVTIPTGSYSVLRGTGKLTEFSLIFPQLGNIVELMNNILKGNVRMTLKYVRIIKGSGMRCLLICRTF